MSLIAWWLWVTARAGPKRYSMIVKWQCVCVCVLCVLSMTIRLHWMTHTDWQLARLADRQLRGNWWVMVWLVGKISSIRQQLNNVPFCHLFHSFRALTPPTTHVAPSVSSTLTPRACIDDFANDRLLNWFAALFGRMRSVAARRFSTLPKASRPAAVGD